MRKQKKKSQTVISVHRVQCELCHKIHLAQDSGWTVNGHGMVLCSGDYKDDGCFAKFRKRKQME